MNHLREMTRELEAEREEIRRTPSWTNILDHLERGCNREFGAGEIMTNLQRLELRASEIRSRLNELSGIETGELTSRKSVRN